LQGGRILLSTWEEEGNEGGGDHEGDEIGCSEGPGNRPLRNMAAAKKSAVNLLRASSFVHLPQDPMGICTNLIPITTAMYPVDLTSGCLP